MRYKYYVMYETLSSPGYGNEYHTRSIPSKFLILSKHKKITCALKSLRKETKTVEWWSRLRYWIEDFDGNVLVQYEKKFNDYVFVKLEDS